MHDGDRAIERLMHFLSIEGVTGQEQAIQRAVHAALMQAGVKRGWLTTDEVHRKIPLPTQCGNLIARLPGTRPGPRRLFMTHLDTVPLCAGAKPVRKGDRIVPEGPTALGGDNRVGVACLVTMLATLLERELPHGPLTALFTVREESGLSGARFVEPADLGHPVLGFNVDGSSPRHITVGAVGAERWEVEIHGKAAHAGLHPERGISATMVAALALAEVQQGGWFGKVQQDGREGTSNVGSFGDPNGKSAGEATNVVTDRVLIRGEARSHDAKFVRAITAAYKEAFRSASCKLLDHKGRPAKVRFTSRLDYYPFRLKDNSAVVQIAQKAAACVGWEPTLRVTNGGVDANWLVRHRVPTITFGAGQNNVHTIEEYVHLPDFLDGCNYALALAVQE